LNVSPPPTRVDAEQARLDSATYARMYYEGLSADYPRIAEQGRKVQRALQGARKVRITTPEGTPVETSVSGKIRAPSDQCDKPVKDEAIDVRAGMPENVHAGSDEECVKASLQRAGRFGWVEIGLNPALRVEDPNVNLASALLDLGAGAVTVDFGTNQELGGDNKTSSGGWYIVLPRATVEADGKVIVREGELAM